MTFNLRISAVIPWMAFLLLIPGLASDSQLLAQEADKVQGLEGLRPAKDAESTEEASQDQAEQDLKKKSPSKEEESAKKEEKKEESKEAPSDTRSDLEKLIDEQVPDFDPLDALDATNPTAKVGQLVDEISKNMKEIERLLDQDETGESNQSMQQQTLSRIDELINEVQKMSGG